MGRPEQVVELLRAGSSPERIAKTLGISVLSVSSYLDNAVGKGLIRRSEIYFSLPPDRRELYPVARAALGDMYDDLRRIELTLHRHVRETLTKAFTNDEWWRRGVPEAVRVKCVERRERDQDDEPCEPYCYTDLLDLGKIMEDHWLLFKDHLPTCYSSNRKALLEALARLNRIRNKVMHPVRGLVPCSEDFTFVQELEAAICPGSGHVA